MDHGERWMAHMRCGQFEEAWRISDEVLAERAAQCCDHLARHEQWLWKGEPLAGRCVVIRCYHGLGDTVQFVRYISLVRKIAARVVLEAQPELLPLLENLREPRDALRLRARCRLRRGG